MASRESKSASSISQSDGIALLQKAEREAADKINEARKRKARRLKLAKDEAKAEIEKFKNERDTEYKSHETELFGSKNTYESTVNIETEEKLSTLKKAVTSHKEEALAKLIGIVCDIQPKLHINYKDSEAA